MTIDGVAARRPRARFLAMNAIPFVRAASALAFAELLDDQGVSIRRSWAAAGLPPSALAEPEALLPLHLVLRFTEDAAEAQGAPDLGLCVARRSGIESTGRFGRAIRDARTLRTAIQTARDMAPAHSNGERYWLRDEGASVRFCRRLRRIDGAFRQIDLFSVALMVDLVRLVAGPRWCPRHIELQSPGEQGLRGQEIFGEARVEVARPVTSVTFPRAFLDRALPQHPGRRASAIGGRRWRGSLPPSDFLASFEVVVTTLLEAQRLELAEAARAAGLSVRSLQRRLTEIGASYTEVVDRVRFEVAVGLLEDLSVKIIEIAFALDYSDHAHFTRAFRRWTSLTPREYRQLHANGPATALRSA
jgi:AraC-like DNA-binding protein